jgi:hypothetical protein
VTWSVPRVFCGSAAERSPGVVRTTWTMDSSSSGVVSAKATGISCEVPALLTDVSSRAVCGRSAGARGVDLPRTPMSRLFDRACSFSTPAAREAGSAKSMTTVRV